MARVAILSLSLAALAVLCIRDLPILISARECTSIDVRNSVSSLSALDGCSVIKGYLLIVLILNSTPQDFTNLSYPELKEITDFFMFHEVTGLTDLKTLFPNLVVIRGRRLFLNYAFAVSNMPDLAALELRSLIAIQRGHVYIGNSPKLCFLKKIDWERLTLIEGMNSIIPMDKNTCPPADCMGCETEHCWSNRVCQKFENDNLINLNRGNLHCHPQCLGGCYNETYTGCNVCKGISYHGACVQTCPPHLYYSENHQRCYTKEECYAVRFYILGSVCNRKCPSGYNHSRKVGECIKCATGCVRECVPEEPFTAAVISTLSDAEALKGCQLLRSNLFIQLGNPVDEKDLANSFQSLQEIEGHVKVIYSPHLKTLDFLKNLEKIHGNPLENDTFAMVIYQNANLQELWTPAAGKSVEFVNGGIYSFANKKLCNHILQEFGERIIHNKDKDLIQINDQEVLCEPVRLFVGLKNTTQNSAMIFWAINQTAEEVEIIYREAKYFKGEESELDDGVCQRVHWKRQLLFKADIPSNSSHFFYNITGLLPNYQYDYLVKTFEEKDYYSARSLLQRFTTTPDLPTPPKLITLSKNHENITLSWILRNEIEEVVKYYILETFEHPVDLKTIDTKDHCNLPIKMYGNSDLEDFDVCCQRKRDQMQDDEFKRDMEKKFACSVNSKDNCHKMVRNAQRTNVTNITIFDSKAENFTVGSLKHFTQYTFFLYGCNNFGCGTYSMHNERTTALGIKDKVISVFACANAKLKRYTVHFQEPPNPNGAILNYHIFFRNLTPVAVPTNNTGFMNCVTRKEFEDERYETFINFDDKSIYEQISVRSFSIGANVMSDWFDISTCVSSKSKISNSGIFFICLAVIGAIAFIWFCYRRNWWTYFSLNRWRREAQRLYGAVGMDDRQELVARFDTVVFHNVPDDGLL